MLKPLTESISLYLDKDVRDRVAELAAKQDRSISKYITMVLKAHIAEVESGKALIDDIAEKRESEKCTLTITVDSVVLGKIREYADLDDRSTSYYINRLLRSHIKKQYAIIKKERISALFIFRGYGGLPPC